MRAFANFCFSMSCFIREQYDLYIAIKRLLPCS